MTRPPFPDALLERISQSRVVAVLIIDHVEHAVPLAEALLEGGIGVMELTLRTPVAVDALRAIRQHIPEMVAGIGTILTPDQVDEVVDAGAAFGVAPGLNPNVVRRAREQELPFAPGVVTPSEVERAVELGCRVLKFFPAEPSGGVSYLRSMNAPYAHLGLRYIPLGGLNSTNASNYLQEDFIPAVGGSWIAPRDLIGREDWAMITRNAATASQL